MGELRSFAPGPKREQSCPICGSRLLAGALYCEHCGTDLSRTGVLFSTDVRPLSASRRGSAGRWILGIAVGTATAVAALAVLGGLPAVSARVPTLRALRDGTGQTVQRAVRWSRDLVAHRAPTPSPGVLPAPGAASPVLAGLTLTVLSTPPGAAVYLNDRPAGTTPLAIEGLEPGTYRVKILRAGYAPEVRTVNVGPGDATVEVALAAPPRTPPPSRTSPRPAPRTAARPPASSPRPPMVGTPAPPFSLKDRLGIIYRLESFRGRRTAVLFVWDLEPDEQRLIRELDDRAEQTPALAALVVVMRADRVAVRGFLATWPVRVPLVFGTPQVARQYRLTPGVPALYLISERGTIDRVYTGTVRPRTLR
ncbi:MAG: PEGA domain-containing protein [Armatimonadota bacterium]|nr:PEGA domain-containing protein [Armatimonadota bacterium]MDR7436175.1 PEGA domain-containing protein [Armatimonadota bacterium]MDR7472054.1 PEGA domain-containing protein [Armatimonadota bacterium]MDR7507149.1 PEGA domain-containing protein [Armatimonadota bacterium]MDR7509750.1 PEGA domain-containing protein [Armatimonadota bacterium]